MAACDGDLGLEEVDDESGCLEPFFYDEAEVVAEAAAAAAGDRGEGGGACAEGGGVQAEKGSASGRHRQGPRVRSKGGGSLLHPILRHGLLHIRHRRGV